jgi:hypothetical protein
MEVEGWEIPRKLKLVTVDSGVTVSYVDWPQEADLEETAPEKTAPSPRHTQTARRRTTDQAGPRRLERRRGREAGKPAQRGGGAT